MTNPITTLKSLTWPTARETTRLSATTIIVAVAATVVLWGIGLALTAGVNLLAH